MYCDSCREPVRRSRIVCLDCDNLDRWATNTLDFCRKVACHDSGKLDSRTEHTKAHLLLKVRERLLTKDFYVVKSNAKDGMSWAQSNYLRLLDANVCSAATDLGKQEEISSSAIGQMPVTDAPSSQNTSMLSGQSPVNGFVTKHGLTPNII
jgi:hypothetical protein